MLKKASKSVEKETPTPKKKTTRKPKAQAPEATAPVSSGGQKNPRPISVSPEDHETNFQAGVDSFQKVKPKVESHSA